MTKSTTSDTDKKPDKVIETKISDHSKEAEAKSDKTKEASKTQENDVVMIDLEPKTKDPTPPPNTSTSRTLKKRYFEDFNLVFFQKLIQPSSRSK